MMQDELERKNPEEQVRQVEEVELQVRQLLVQL